MAKYKLLEVGDRVWIETQGFYMNSISEYEIVKANKSSAYAVNIEDLNKGKYVRRRIIQKTREVKNNFAGYYYIFWESKEAFEDNVKAQKEKRELRKEAIDKLNSMSLKELRELKKFLWDGANK